MVSTNVFFFSFKNYKEVVDGGLNENIRGRLICPYFDLIK